MSAESRRVLRRIDAAILDLAAARDFLQEKEGVEIDFVEAKAEIDSAVEALNLAGAVCDEQ